jgi:hypothetical protein
MSNKNWTLHRDKVKGRTSCSIKICTFPSQIQRGKYYGKWDIIWINMVLHHKQHGPPISSFMNGINHTTIIYYTLYSEMLGIQSTVLHLLNMHMSCVHYDKSFMWFLTYLVGKRNWSRVSASWDHICWNGWGCLRARGRPVRSMLNRLVTASFQVPGDGQPYFIDRGTWSAWKWPIQLL